MLEDVKERLLQLGYECSEDDESSLTFLIDKSYNFILDYCNIDEVPDSVYQVQIDYICAEFLRDKSMKGGLDGFVLKDVHSITEGDVSVQYSTSGSTSFTINSLYTWAEKQLYSAIQPFRTMRW